MSNQTQHAGEFCWNELMTPDTQKAQAFYTALLGWTTQVHQMKEMTYTIFISGEKSIGGMLQTPKDKVNEIPPHWMSYIYVENLEQTLEKAKGLGANIKVPITNVTDMGSFAIITDPTGAHIAFWQSIKSA